MKIIPNRGAYVIGISEKDVHDIYLIRSELEGLCVRMAAEHITKEKIEELEEALILSEYHLEKDNMEQLTELDGKFHQILYAASESRILEHVLSDFHKYVQLARRNSVKEKSRAKQSIAEHRQILNAIKEGNADEAEKFANTHILNVMKHLHMSQE